jgi:hypothetical protein
MTLHSSCTAQTAVSSNFAADSDYSLRIEDREWLQQNAQALRSQTDYLIAEHAKDACLHERAAEMTIWRDGRFISVRELVDQCASHNWNGLIYEAWVFQTACRVHDLIRTLDETVARAVKLRAQQLDYYEVDYSEMVQALEEARREIYGKAL